MDHFSKKIAPLTETLLYHAKKHQRVVSLLEEGLGYEIPSREVMLRNTTLIVKADAYGRGDILMKKAKLLALFKKNNIPITTITVLLR